MIFAESWEETPSKHRSEGKLITYNYKQYHAMRCSKIWRLETENLLPFVPL
jgi:hypothetical protein